VRLLATAEESPPEFAVVPQVITLPSVRTAAIVAAFPAYDTTAGLSRAVAVAPLGVNPLSPQAYIVPSVFSTANPYWFPNTSFTPEEIWLVMP
jgi:hypothetical protein